MLTTLVDIDSHLRDNLRDCVLIVTDNPAESRAVSQNLTKKGYLVATCIFDGKTLDGVPQTSPDIILFYFFNYSQDLPRLVAEFKIQYSDPYLTTIGIFTPNTSQNISIFDSVVFPPLYPLQIVARVTAMLRINRMQREICLRLETLKEDFGETYTLRDLSTDTPLRVLLIGKASPECLVIINALEDRGINVVAAFTSFTAFDFIHEIRFDAVIIHASGSSSAAKGITQMMRRNSQHFHTPVLLLNDPDAELPDSPFDLGVNDIIPYDAEPEEIGRRILEAANYYQLHTNLKQEFSRLGSIACMDLRSGVFNTDFARAHLERINQSYADTKQPSSLVLFQFNPNVTTVPPDRLRKAQDSLGAILLKIVRMEDVIFRLSSDIYGVVFPGFAQERIGVAHDRILDVFKEHVFARGNSPHDVFCFATESHVSHITPGQDTGSFLETSINALKSKSKEVPGRRA